MNWTLLDIGPFGTQTAKSLDMIKIIVRNTNLNSADDCKNFVVLSPCTPFSRGLCHIFQNFQKSFGWSVPEFSSQKWRKMTKTDQNWL